jgi:hypothetical protein
LAGERDRSVQTDNLLSSIAELRGFITGAQKVI